MSCRPRTFLPSRCSLSFFLLGVNDVKNCRNFRHKTEIANSPCRRAIKSELPLTTAFHVRIELVSSRKRKVKSIEALLRCPHLCGSKICHTLRFVAFGIISLLIYKNGDICVCVHILVGWFGVSYLAFFCCSCAASIRFIASACAFENATMDASSCCARACQSIVFVLSFILVWLVGVSYLPLSGLGI